MQVLQEAKTFLRNKKVQKLFYRITKTIKKVEKYFTRNKDYPIFQLHLVALNQG